MASLAAHPGGAVRSATLPDAWAAPRGWSCARGMRFAADERSLSVDLGEDGRLRSPSPSPLPWPRRAFGALGPAQVVPGPEPVLAPVAAARAGERQRRAWATQTIDLDGAVAYAEKNWGAGGMPPAWWWGQAHGFDRPDVCVAFAGGRAGLGPLRATATALVVAVGDEVRTVVRPLRPLRVGVDERGWRLAGGGIEVAGARRRRRPAPAAGARPARAPAPGRLGAPAPHGHSAPERAPPRAHALSGHVAPRRPRARPRAPG